ncbi:MAG: hypothetical protein HY704_05325 [Gemmatimonadetes bacterium]|nr:hypothetical protein [Gemmatimonadota bacterium]
MRRLALLLLPPLAALPAVAQVPPGDTLAPAATAGHAPAPAALPLRLDLPVLDAPYNLAHGVRVPSMRQSLSLSAGFYEASHRAIREAWGKGGRLMASSVVLFDYLATYLPLGDSWLHEEYHRAVMGNRGIDSHNDVYNFKIGAEAIAVSHVKDEDLARLKRQHPAEQVRLSAAGLEGGYRLLQELEKNGFFRGTTAPHLPLLWLVRANSAAYVFSGHTNRANKLADEAARAEGAAVEVRDFAGHDFTAWVYDLHRADEPYEARGIHPSGVGIDRYIKAADLTREERDFLELQGWLQLLNFVDPNLIGLRGFAARKALDGRRLAFNLSLGHLLTSFGYTLDANVFLRQGRVNLFVVLHGYANGARRFPGIDAALLEYPVTIGGRSLALSPRAALWLQPEQQRFRSTRAVAGGLAALRVDHPLSQRLGSFIEVEGKTAGWVAGTVDLASNVSVRLGVSTVLR